MIPQIADTQKTPRYVLPRRLAAGLVWAALVQRRRSFAHDAGWAVSGLQPPPRVLGTDNIPPRGPCLVVCNHYSRDGLGVWWGGLALSAAIAEHRAPSGCREIRWVMTAAWTFPSRPGTVGWKHRVLTPLTRWAFTRAARVYGFVPMPPMPPDPDEFEARAAAVLRTVRLARRIAPQGGMIGLAPEGRDVPGEFGQLPAGAGAFMALLVSRLQTVGAGLQTVGAGLQVLPVGVWEQAETLCISFGPPFKPHIPAERARRDKEVARQVVSAIKQCLP